MDDVSSTTVICDLVIEDYIDECIEQSIINGYTSANIDIDDYIAYSKYRDIKQSTINNIVQYFADEYRDEGYDTFPYEGSLTISW